MVKMLPVSSQDHVLLQKLSIAPSTPQGLALKARIILKASQGFSNTAIAEKCATSRQTVTLWKNRYKQKGIIGIMHMAEGRGRKRTVSKKTVEQIIYDTLHTKPTDSDFWTTRTLAARHNVSHDMVKKIWQANNLKPWLVKTFKLSHDKQFVEKLRDVVGLYLNPPEHAVIFCIDEKTSIQALERTRENMVIDGKVTQTHDYTRHGTTTLFAALDYLRGRVIGSCMQKHRHEEFIAFLEKIEKSVEKNLEIHCIVDNYGTHKRTHSISQVD